MKKIAIKVSDDLKNHPALNLIQKNLTDSKLITEIFKNEDVIQSTHFDGLIFFVSNSDHVTAETTAFHSESKPLIVFAESSHNVALVLKKYNPVIATESLNPDIANLQKQGIDAEVCPVDDFITDRYTKILSSSLRLVAEINNESYKKGILALCKELVEMC
jgi:enhancing lycopene biosynthesis protein 2